MSGEPITPMLTESMVRADNGKPLLMVTVFVDPASWRAMVERAARADYSGTDEQWKQTKLQQAYREANVKILRAALNLPDGWTP